MTRLRRAPATLLWAVGLVTTALLVTGCTTIPSSSAPQVLQTVTQQAGGDPVTTPPKDASARDILQAFLNANGNDDSNSARAFLTPNAKNTWIDSTVTVIDQSHISNPDTHNRFTVEGHEIGTVDADGVYTPVLRGAGKPDQYQFGLKQIDGQWRIDTLSPGLLITASDFLLFRQQSIYFFDSSQQRLVPDPRYTAVLNSQALASWLMAQLAGGPRGALTTGLPSQTDPKRVTVDLGSSDEDATTVTVPGAAQLTGASLDRLAAQIASTLTGAINSVDRMQIVDGGAPVRIPAVHGTTFTADEVDNPYEQQPQSAALYYVRDGGIVRDDGRPLPGKVGDGAYGLTSVALARAAGGRMAVAGTRRAGTKTVLDIGTTDRLRATSVIGQLSRPEWVPAHGEVWIGDGDSLVMVNRALHPITVAVNTTSGSATGRVSAVRLSPDGARIALVLTNPDGSSQIWIGWVVRTSDAVRVDGLAPISPQDVRITDVAWYDDLKLFASGSDPRTGVYGVYEVESDGALWSDPAGSAEGLPQTPDSITATATAVAAVSAGTTVWKQGSPDWVALGSPNSLRGNQGTNPVYVE